MPSTIWDITTEHREEFSNTQVEVRCRATRRSLELTHRHIVRIYDFVQDADSACISMEYVDGDTLSNIRAGKPNLIFEPEELQPYVMELCEALDYAHSKAQIVHRDIKPSNLMVNGRGELKVTDFGIARSLTDSVSVMTMSERTSGTLLYMSPQQLDGERTSPLDDIYSVGAVLYELLASKPPFYRRARDDVLGSAAACPYQLNMCQRRRQASRQLSLAGLIC